MIAFSVIVPVYNSMNSLFELTGRIDAVFRQMKLKYEIVFVDDGSTDESWNTIIELRNQYGDIISGYRLAKNFGQHNAIFCGIENSKGEAIITIDDDLQYPPEDIIKLISVFCDRKCDLVYGYAEKRNHSVFRKIGSWYIKKIGKIIHKNAGEGSSFRILSRRLADHIIKHKQEFVYIDELMLWYTNEIAFIPVTHQKRKYNKSGYNATKLLRITFNLMIYYTAIPLKIMIWGGLSASLISFLIGVYYLAKKILFHHAPPGYTSIIVTILFSTGIIILSLGIIGEYLHRIYKFQNKKPPFSLRDQV